LLINYRYVGRSFSVAYMRVVALLLGLLALDKARLILLWVAVSLAVIKGHITVTVRYGKAILIRSRMF